MDTLQLHKNIRDTFYDDQANSPNPFRRWLHSKRHHIVNSLVKRFYYPDSIVFDFGSGSCSWNNDKLPVNGVDINEPLLNHGRQQGRLAEYKVGDISNDILDEESVDILVSTETLEHLRDAGAGVSQMHRVLKSGGVAIVSVPHDRHLSLWSILFSIQRFYKWRIKGDFYYKNNCGHVQKFFPEKLKTLFTDHGFTINTLFSYWTLHIFLVAQKNKRHPRLAYHDVTVIIPVKDHERNLEFLIPELTTCCPGISLIVSNDGSVLENRKIINQLRQYREHINLIERKKHQTRGLTASVLDAIDLVKTKYFIVMDGDGQHKPEYIESIYKNLIEGKNLCTVSRIAVKDWLLHRRIISFLGNFLAKGALLVKGKKFPPDILSGFFGTATDYWRKTTKDKKMKFVLPGYKILFDFLRMCDKNIDIENIYHVLNAREIGESRINWRVYKAFLRSLTQ